MGDAAHVMVVESRANRPVGVVTYTKLPLTAGCCTCTTPPGAGDVKAGDAVHADVGDTRVKSLRPTPRSATHMAVWFCRAIPCGATRPARPRLVKLSAVREGATAIVPVVVAITDVPCEAYILPSKGDTTTARKLLPRRYVLDAPACGNSAPATP